MKQARWLPVLTVSLCVALLPGTSLAQGAAQDYPSRAIHIVVGFAPGGLPDITARAVAEQLSAEIKQPVIVENRPGAGGTSAAAAVARAEPDGYTILSVTSAHAASAALYKLPYDPERDFSAVSLLGTNEMLLIASPSLGIKSLRDLIAHAKAHPGKLNFASAGIGSNTHFSMEVLKTMAGIDIVHVPFKGIPVAMGEVVAGRVQLFMAPLGTVLAQVKRGDVVALASTGSQRNPLVPNIPTASESGVPNYLWEAWFGLLVPAKTPEAIVAKLDKTIGQILKRPDMRDRWAKIGLGIPPSTPQKFDQLIHDQIKLFSETARAANIKAQ